MKPQERVSAILPPLVPTRVQSGYPEEDRLQDLGVFVAHRVLILGCDVEITCALIRRGCKEVTALTRSARPEAHSVEIVIIPNIDTIETAISAIANARHGLARPGCIVVRTGSGPADRLTNDIAEILRFNGFSALHISRTTNRVTFTARLSPESGYSADRL